jgi:hypothetical protein
MSSFNTPGAPASAGGPSVIQRGTISHTSGSVGQTATISAVVMAKSILSHLGSSSEESTIAKGQPRLTLTNTTTVTATLATSPDGSSGRSDFEVVEYA